MSQSSDSSPPPHISDDFWFQVREPDCHKLKKGNYCKEIQSSQNQQKTESLGLNRPETREGVTSSS